MTTKHTPGTWERDNSHPYEIRAGNTTIGYISTKADANLITAAPDLLEACQWTIGIITGGFVDDEPTEEWASQIWQRCRATIAKAQGAPALDPDTEVRR